MGAADASRESSGKRERGNSSPARPRFPPGGLRSDPGAVFPPGMPWGSVAVFLGLLLWNPAGAAGPCWENSKCQELSSQSGILECAAACRADLSLEAPLYPGNGQFQPLSESIRRYVMSHFRWNKFGKGNGNSSSGGGGGSKREEGAGNTPNSQAGASSPIPGGKEEGKRSYSMEHFRWGKPVGRKRRPVKVYPNGVEEEEEEEEAQEYPLEFRRQLGEGREGERGEKREEGKSRWESPLDKRYGGFMGSEKGRTPLVTLFRNTIGKSAAKKGQ
ncbi:pro-opiomelanocortin [Pseudopipra pipra]|uniref:pro-opiomelanocortin n=1 Tax=Pseudopipra pipra TaxID=415032 RepID=UPI003139A5FE